MHCLAGVSRSASVLIAYMIRKYRWDYDKCLEMLKSKRKCCMPNYGFRQQLLELEEGLGKGSAYQSEKQ